jgi:hypothetical protein
MCSRILPSLIHTDLSAVSHNQSTLANPVLVAFPNRAETLTLQSKEDLAAAQLHLRKDYVSARVSIT